MFGRLGLKTTEDISSRWERLKKDGIAGGGRNSRNTRNSRCRGDEFQGMGRAASKKKRDRNV